MIWSLCFDKAGDKEDGLDANKIIISSIITSPRRKIKNNENNQEEILYFVGG